MSEFIIGAAIAMLLWRLFSTLDRIDRNTTSILSPPEPPEPPHVPVHMELNEKMMKEYMSQND